MENKEVQPKNNHKRNEVIYRIAIVVLGLLVLLLTILWVTCRQSLNEMTMEREIAAQRSTELQSELNLVLDEYQMVKLEYDSVLVDKDSIIEANAREIQNLINRQADYNRIRRQLNMLREITQNYVLEIDSLYKENQVLKAMNVQMREEIEIAQRRASELTVDKMLLEWKVEEASALRAYEIEVTPFRLRGRGDREDETDRAGRVEQIRVCFKIGENPIVEAGDYNAYMRIVDPFGQVLQPGDVTGYNIVLEGDTLKYSVRDSFYYENQATHTCITWHRVEEFEAGVYTISLFTDDSLLGETFLELR